MCLLNMLDKRHFTRSGYVAKPGCWPGKEAGQSPFPSQCAVKLPRRDPVFQALEKFWTIFRIRIFGVFYRALACDKTSLGPQGRRIGACLPARPRWLNSCLIARIRIYQRSCPAFIRDW
jgi:hypothetical protein